METNEKAQFELLLDSSIENQEFVKLALGKYKGQEDGLRKIFVRIIRIKSGIKLSFVYSYDTKEIEKNYSINEGIVLVKSIIGNEFMSCTLFTVKQDVYLEYSKKGKSRLSYSKPTFSDPVSVNPEKHDRKKKYYIEPENSAYLNELGITNNQGRIVKGMESKFKQINKFIEIIHGLLNSSGLISKERISVLDMGSGKGYLTFALYDFLSSFLDKEASVIGVENRLNLVEFCNSLSRSINFKGLRFEHGNIKNYTFSEVDITIALHACDTATDDAIYKGILSSSPLIVLAPCCHKQIRRQMSPNLPVKDLLRSGILMERQAEIVTDGVRALLLEAFGYNANGERFFSGEMGIQGEVRCPNVRFLFPCHLSIQG